MQPGRAVIIGSGPSGLVSALLLAEAGWTVTLLEQHVVPGGFLQRFRRGGSWFDTGFHFVTGSEPGGIFRRLCARLGVREQMDFLAPEADGQFRLHLADDEPLDLPVGLDASLDALARRWPSQADACVAFFAQLRAVLGAQRWLAAYGAAGSVARDATRGSVLENATRIGGVHDGRDAARDVASLDAHASVADVLARCGVRGPAADALGSLCAILAMRAETCPFALYADFAGTAMAGAFRLRGGGAGFVEPVLARLRDLGVAVHRGAGAERVLFTGRTVHAVRDARGVEHATDLVLATCHPAELVRITGDEGFRPEWLRQVRAAEDSCAAFQLFAELDGRADGASGAHTVTMASGVDSSSNATGAPRVTGASGVGRRHHLLRTADGRDAYAVLPALWESDHPPRLEALVWTQAASRCESPFAADSASASRATHSVSRAAPGSHALPPDRRSPAYVEWKDAQERDLRALLDARLDGCGSRITRSWTSSAHTIQHFTRSRGGSAMGLTHTVSGRAARSLVPRNRLRNLLMAGQSVFHPGILGTVIGTFALLSTVLERDLCAEVVGSDEGE